MVKNRGYIFLLRTAGPLKEHCTSKKAESTFYIHLNVYCLRIATAGHSIDLVAGRLCRRNPCNVIVLAFLELTVAVKVQRHQKMGVNNLTKNRLKRSSFIHTAKKKNFTRNMTLAPLRFVLVM